MLQENLILNEIQRNGTNIFVFNNYALWVAKLSHVLFLLFLSTRSVFYFSTPTMFAVFLLGFIFIVCFFAMSWLYTFQYIKEIMTLDLIEDEEVKPYMLNEILPQIFFSICNFLLLKLLHIAHFIVFLKSSSDYISIPLGSLIIYYIFFSVYTIYSIIFKYENSIDVFTLGISGILTLWCYAFKMKLLFLPCLTSSGFYLLYRLKKFKDTKQYYYNEEQQFIKIPLYCYASMFFVLFLMHFQMIRVELFSLILSIAFFFSMYADLNLQKLEKTYDTIENRIIQKYVSSFELNKKTPGTLD